MYLLHGITGYHMIVPQVTSPVQTLSQTAPDSVHTSTLER